MKVVSVKGYVLEYFVYKILESSGFTNVMSDDTIVYESGIGTMIHGLGQPHNADVLMNPPFQIPFYFPSRILIECKCHHTEIGINIVRSVLGLRNDINEFDIVTPEILKNRRSSRRTKASLYDFRRYYYNVGLASITNYKTTAIEFAYAHKIPLISFAEGKNYQELRDFISIIDSLYQELPVKTKQIFNKCIKQRSFNNFHFDYNYSINTSIRIIRDFLRYVDSFTSKTAVGVLDDGTILVMSREDNPHGQRMYQDGFTIHWSEELRSWSVENGSLIYSFELPASLFEKWLDMSVDLNKEDALRIKALQLKENYFRKIAIFERDENNNFSAKTLILSRNFIETARDEIKKSHR